MKNRTRKIRAAWACLLAGLALDYSSAARSESNGSGREDARLTEDFTSCDRKAERDAAQASQLSPIAPTSVLNPILLLNDFNRRKQEEANRPQLLDQIDRERQQCRNNAVAASARRAQELINQKSDSARGYRSISFETFALDAKGLAATQSRISMKGAYLPDGNLEWLFASQIEAMQARTPAGDNVTKIPLLTDTATREFRQALLRCKSTPGSDRTGCPTIITGYVSICSITGPLGNTKSLPCIIVENGRGGI